MRVALNQPMFGLGDTGYDAPKIPRSIGLGAMTQVVDPGVTMFPGIIPYTAAWRAAHTKANYPLLGKDPISSREAQALSWWMGGASYDYYADKVVFLPNGNVRPVDGTQHAIAQTNAYPNMPQGGRSPDESAYLLQNESGWVYQDFNCTPDNSPYDPCNRVYQGSLLQSLVPILAPLALVGGAVAAGAIAASSAAASAGAADATAEAIAAQIAQSAIPATVTGTSVEVGAVGAATAAGVSGIISPAVSAGGGMLAKTVVGALIAKEVGSVVAPSGGTSPDAVQAQLAAALQQQQAASGGNTNLLLIGGGIILLALLVRGG